VVPSELLAKALAGEWLSQDEYVRPMWLPLTRLTGVAVDFVARNRDMYEQDLLRILGNDAATHWDKPPIESSRIYELQKKEFGPILKWAKKQFGIAPALSKKFLKIVKQPTSLIKIIRDYIRNLDDYHLAAFEQLASNLRSVMLALALVHGRISVLEAARMGRLEDICGQNSYGFVAGAHDLDEVDFHVRVAGAYTFWLLLGDNFSQNPKKAKK